MTVRVRVTRELRGCGGLLLVYILPELATQNGQDSTTARLQDVYPLRSLQELGESTLCFP